MVDVLVIGGGNAALCAALMAREAGASVLMLESAPREWRGGNSMHMRNLRCMHDAPQDVLLDAYPGRGVLAGPAEGHRRRDRREAGAAGDPRFRPPAATGCASTACASSRRSPARCTCRAPTPSSWAAARRWSMPITAARRALGVQVRYDSPVDAARAARTAASSRRTVGERAHRGRRPACWPAAASNRTASGCARPGGRTSAANGRPTTS